MAPNNVPDPSITEETKDIPYLLPFNSGALDRSMAITPEILFKGPPWNNPIPNIIK